MKSTGVAGALLVTVLVACGGGETGQSSADVTSKTDEASATIASGLCPPDARQVSSDGTRMVSFRCFPDRYEVVQSATTTSFAGQERILQTIPIVGQGELRTRIVPGAQVDGSNMFDFEEVQPSDLHRVHHFHRVLVSPRLWSVAWPEGAVTTYTRGGRYAVGVSASRVAVLDLAADEASPVTLPVAIEEGETLSVFSSPESEQIDRRKPSVLVVHNAKNGAINRIDRLLVDGDAPRLEAVPGFEPVAGIAAGENGMGYAHIVAFEDVSADGETATLVSIQTELGTRRTIGRGYVRSLLRKDRGVFYVAPGADGGHATLHHWDGSDEVLSAADADVDPRDGLRLEADIISGADRIFYLNRAAGCTSTSGIAYGRLESVVAGGTPSVVAENVASTLAHAKSKWLLAVGKVTEVGVCPAGAPDVAYGAILGQKMTTLATIASSMLAGAPATGVNLALSANGQAAYFASTHEGTCTGAEIGVVTNGSDQGGWKIGHVSLCSGALAKDAFSAVPSRDDMLVGTTAKEVTTISIVTPKVVTTRSLDGAGTPAAPTKPEDGEGPTTGDDDVTAGSKKTVTPAAETARLTASSSCSASAGAGSTGGAAWLFLVGLVGIARRGRSRRPNVGA